MNDDIVVTSALTKTYGERAAVDRIDLTVRRGEVYGFLGPNGAGKTTTLRMLLGLVRPTSGEARVLGGRPGEPDVLARVGALVEGPGLYPYLSGRDNLRVLARYRGLDEVDVEAALELVDLAGRASDKYRSYSLGMKQRLGVAAALLGRPELLVLDEPTNGLDPAGMEDMRELVRALADQGQTVMLSSHLLGEVQEICDRVGIIAQGRIMAEGTVAELRGEPRLRVRAEPLDRAADVVSRVVGIDRMSTVDGVLYAAAVPATAAELTRALVVADVAVYEMRPEERSLAEAFFDLTDDRATGLRTDGMTDDMERIAS